MNDALSAVEAVPTIRPKGVTKRQWRLAALLPRCETAYEALRKAGYTHLTARAIPGRISAAIGTVRAGEAIAQRQADKAKGLFAVGTMALETAQEDLRAMEPRERLAAGVKYIEVAHQLGENVEVQGNGSRWQARVHRAVRLGMRLTEQRLSLTEDELEKANQRHERREDFRMRHMVTVTARPQRRSDNDTRALSRAKAMNK